MNATYQTVKNVIVQQIQRNYEHGQDMAKSLRDMKPYDLEQCKPKLGKAKATKANKMAIEQKVLEILY